MICFPNAKINIGLYITGKRPDGYHNIETLFYPTKLHDVLEIIENNENDKPYIWSSSGINIEGNPDDNLCIKALNLLKEDFLIPPVKIHLHKVIPFGAGLGGGSADAAFTLDCLNKMFKLGISKKLMIKYASKIGADCAFFIYNTPCIATGIGDILHPSELSLKGKYLVLIKPQIHISTPEAYSGVKPQKHNESLLQKLSNPISQWKNKIVNDFEASVFPNHPKLETIKQDLYHSGAVYAAMTGSGAAIFGIFDEDPKISSEDYFVWTEQI